VFGQVRVKGDSKRGGCCAENSEEKGDRGTSLERRKGGLNAWESQEGGKGVHPGSNRGGVKGAWKFRKKK